MDQTRIDDEALNDLCRQADEALQSGDPQAARQIYEAVLSIDPDEPRALAAIARFDAEADSAGWDLADLAPGSPALPVPAISAVPAMPPVPAPAAMPAAPTLATAPVQIQSADAVPLELDLDLAFQTPAKARPWADVPKPTDTREGDGEALDAMFAPPPPQAHAPDDLPEMRDLLDAANDLADEREVDTPEDSLANRNLAGVDAGAGEAALLAARARGELESGNVEDARQLAARALALSERCAAAQTVLDEINARNDRAARESEQLLCEAGLELDRGRPDLAVPLLRQALVLAPGHPEIQEYLARAEAACEDGIGFQPAPPPPHRSFDAPAVAGTVPAAPSRTPPLPSPSAGGMSHGNVAGPPIGSVASIPVAAPPPPPPPSVPPPPPPAAASSRTTPVSARGKKKAGGAAASGVAKLVRVAVLILVLAGLGAAERLMHDSIAGFFGWGGDDADTETTEPVKRAKVKPADGAPAPAAATTAAPAPPAPTRADVPDLLARADARLAARDEKGAVELLTTAQALAPDEFSIVEKLQRARGALRVREDADAKIREAKARFAQDDYEEGLRLLYRIPDPHKPSNLKRWIANGWYNVGIQRMQTGDLAEAIQDFSNCLEERPDDEAARRHREVARRYRGHTLDDAYRIYVNGLGLRRMEQ